MHALDFQTGKAGIAFTGEVPWHGLGQILTPGASLEEWEREAGLEWTAKRAGVSFERQILDLHTGQESVAPSKAKGYQVLYRSDTGAVLSIMTDRYQPVQPKQIIEFYRDLTEKYGFELETAGSLKDGKKIWALANCKNAFQLRGNDVVKAYLLLATSFDGSMSTQARFTSVRVVCNNTITIATETGKADVTVPHSTAFDADAVKLELNIGEAFDAFRQQSEAMSQRVVSKDEVADFFLTAYLGVQTQAQRDAAAGDEKVIKQIEKLQDRLKNALFNSPGSHLASARGTLWGILNAVTFDVDFARPARSQENRLNAAWFGEGNLIKQRAWQKALAMTA